MKVFSSRAVEAGLVPASVPSITDSHSDWHRKWGHATFSSHPSGVREGCSFAHPAGVQEKAEAGSRGAGPPLATFGHPRWDEDGAVCAAPGGGFLRGAGGFQRHAGVFQ